ncbi:hypothetical protein [uncultured Pseudoteredinibacter sp.]|uniref:hypothetical protein n=1 Tax=uncultured Pseudoteredinibacter sp. TaxID=1641701 RepID=UPI00260B4840|nr:hypothetical protein [uncultured Pseudoteredinibacter sp.]
MNKRWALSVFISMIFGVGIIAYYHLTIKKAICLSSDGVWSVFYEGCDISVEGGFYSITISPVAMATILAIWLSLIALFYLLLGRFHSLGR